MAGAGHAGREAARVACVPIVTATSARAARSSVSVRVPATRDRCPPPASPSRPPDAHDAPASCPRTGLHAGPRRSVRRRPDSSGSGGTAEADNQRTSHQRGISSPGGAGRLEALTFPVLEGVASQTEATSASAPASDVEHRGARPCDRGWSPRSSASRRSVAPAASHESARRLAGSAGSGTCRRLAREERHREGVRHERAVRHRRTAVERGTLGSP